MQTDRRGNRARAQAGCHQKRKREDTLRSQLVGSKAMERLQVWLLQGLGTLEYLPSIAPA